MKATCKGKEEERRHHIDLLNYSFASKNSFRFILSMLKSIRITLLYTQELLGVYSFTFTGLTLSLRDKFRLLIYSAKHYFYSVAHLSSVGIDMIRIIRVMFNTELKSFLTVSSPT